MSSEEENAGDETPNLGKRWISVQYVVKFVTRMVRGLLFPKYLGPTLYGLYSSLAVVQRYGKFADLGMDEWMAKRLPARLEQGGDEAFREEFAKGVTWTLVTAPIFCFGVAVVGLVQSWEHAWFYEIALPIIAAGMVVMKVDKLYQRAGKSREKFGATSRAGIISQTVGVALCVILLLIFDIIGLVVGMTTFGIINVVLLSRVVEWPGFGKIPFSEIKVMLVGGLTLVLLNGVETLMSTVDRVFILSAFDKAKFGMYSFGQFTSSVALMVCNVYTVIIHPRLMRRVEAGGYERAYQILNFAVLSLWSILCLGFPLGYILTELVVTYYLPQYAEAIPVYFVIAGESFVRGPILLMQPYFIARDEESLLIRSYLVVIGVAIALDAAALYFGAGLMGIILATIVAYTLLNVQMLYKMKSPAVEGGAGKYLFLVVGAATVVSFTLVVSRPEGLVAGFSQLAEMGVLAALSLAATGVCAMLVWQPLEKATEYFWF